jgi:uncharacterized protein related to proFAR isomerase
VSSSVRTATVGTFATMETTRAASGTTVTAEAVPAVSSKAALDATASVEAASAAIEAGSSVKTSSFEITSIAASIVTTTVVTAATVKAMEPWTSADKDTACEVVRTVVAVRRASIRVIPVVAVGANRSRTVVGRADPNAYNHSLRMRRNCGQEHANCQQTHIS